MHVKQEIRIQQNPGGAMISSRYEVIVVKRIKEQNKCLNLTFSLTWRRMNQVAKLRRFTLIHIHN